MNAAVSKLKKDIWKDESVDKEAEKSGKGDEKGAKSKNRTTKSEAMSHQEFMSFLRTRHQASEARRTAVRLARDGRKLTEEL